MRPYPEPRSAGNGCRLVRSDYGGVGVGIGVALGCKVLVGEAVTVRCNVAVGVDVAPGCGVTVGESVTSACGVVVSEGVAPGCTVVVGESPLVAVFGSATAVRSRKVPVWVCPFEPELASG